MDLKRHLECPGLVKNETIFLTTLYRLTLTPESYSHTQGAYVLADPILYL